MKAFNLPIEYVLYELSYPNMVLYGASLPTYRSKKEKEKIDLRSKESIDGDDPANRDKVNAFIDSLD